MRLWAVLGDRGGDMRYQAPCMAGHAQAAMKNLHRGGRGPHLHLLLRELIGHAVPVVVKRYVIVDVDAVGFPVTILIAFRGQGAQRRLVERFEEAAARSLALAKGPVVEPDNNS